ncbi:MAG: hypothetical protein WCP96_21760 [Methylococcaceae bacterium]
MSIESWLIYYAQIDYQNGMTANVIKLSRSLNGVEAILPASAPLSQRFIFPRGA